MARNVVLVNWTDQGIRSVGEWSSSWGAAWRQALYWTRGRYDLVGVVEAPDDETVAAPSPSSAERGGRRRPPQEGPFLERRG